MATEEAAEEALLDSLTVPGGRLLVKHSGSILGAVKTALVGKDVFLYGPSEAGKTSLIRYMKTQARTKPNEEREATRRTKNRYYSAYKFSGHSSEEIAIRRLRDRPGNASGEMQATVFGDELPHHSIVMLNAQTPFEREVGESIEKYIKEFWGELRRAHNPLPDRILRIWFVVNKVDKLTKRRADSLVKKVETLLRSQSADVIFPARVKVRTCSLVAGEKWVKMSDDLINEVLTDVAFP